MVIRQDLEDDFDPEDDDFSDLDEPELVELNQIKRGTGLSDTEADFLDTQNQNLDAAHVAQDTSARSSVVRGGGDQAAAGEPMQEGSVSSSGAGASANALGVKSKEVKVSSAGTGSSEAPIEGIAEGIESVKTIKEPCENTDEKSSVPPGNLKQANDLVVSRKKSAVSQLIARFEENNPGVKNPLRSTRSVTPDKTLEGQGDYKGEAVTRPKSAVDSVIKDEVKIDEELPLGAEALLEDQEVDEQDLDEDEMTRRNGAYTSYVLIGAAAGHQAGGHDLETASVHSSGSGGSGNRVVVNVNKGVVLQDGRASNISIVSTESSDLGSPPAEETGHIYEPVPDIPAKIRTRNGGVIDQGPDMQYFVSRDPARPDYQRSRGGEDYLDEDQSLTNYYTNALETSGPLSGGSNSRRGRPPVIRAAERQRRQQMYHEEIGEGEIMVEYEDYPESEHPENFRITEVGPNGEHYEVYTDEMVDEEDDYDVRYESEEHSGDEQYVDNQDYPMCQPVQYDSEEYISEGDEYFDREEELRGYNRQIDFTLHTILEESCEDSDNSEPQRPMVDQRRNKRHSDPSEMEKYFLYGVGGRDEDNEDEYTTGSSSPNEVLEDDLEHMVYDHEQELDQDLMEEDQQPQSMMSDRQNTDDSGSVGSESDGQRTPDPKNKKKVVRAKNGSNTRLSSDNGSQTDEEAEISTGSMKRSKKGSRRGSAGDAEVKKTLNEPNSGVQTIANGSPSSSLSPKGSPPITPLPSQIIEVQPIHPDEDKSSPKSISPTNPSNAIRKHKSRDSGFVGSLDDLLRAEVNANNGHHHSSDSSGQSISDGENSKSAMTISRLEKVSEVSGEDDNVGVEGSNPGGPKSTSPKKSEVLSRKDSFTWSSDEDTNIMMNRMRAFFRSFINSR